MAGSGSIEQREPGAKGKCRTWRLRMSLGYDPLTGDYKRASKTVHGTYREAQAALRAWEAEAEITPSKESFGDALREYVERRSVSDGTKAKNRYQAAALCFHLEHVRLDRLDAATVQEAFDRLAAGDSPSGRELSGTYLQGMRALFGAFAKDAEKRGILKSAQALMPEPIANSTERKSALSLDSVASLIASCSPDDMRHRAIMLSLLAGLRRGECCTVAWSDIDMNARTIHVRGTKTAASDAVVPITPQLYGFLQRCRDHDGRLCPMEPLSLGRWWSRNCDDLGCPGTTFHVLRHTYITLLARAGVHPAVMQSLARHADSRTTMEIYTHVQLEQERAGVSALGQILGQII